ncbi:MAG: GNAT family N-acetyltransferase [Bacteroidetes bacterium]|nr:GNAT family N-acetyltransferase [Bacteroidota bacterium]
MIRYLQHHEIDLARWDDCISRSLNRRVYAYSWYLDVVAPGWDALVLDDYLSVFPLTSGCKAGVSYLFQPFFAQQLGVFSTFPAVSGLATQFFSSIPSRFRYAEIHMTPEFVPESLHTELFQRANHELDLTRSYDEISAEYSQNTRRNIRKAMESGVNTGRNIRPEELVRLFRGNFGEREGKLKDIHYKRMEMLMKVALDKGIGTVQGAFNEHGLLSASAFFLFDRDRMYFLFAASAPEARENGAMFQLIDQFIREHASSPITLDFEGGNDPNLGRFYKSFGALETTYYRILINHMPAFLNSGLKIYRQIREKVNQVHL